MISYHWEMLGYILTDSCKKHLTIHPKCLTTSRHCRDPNNFKSNVLQRHCRDRGPMTRQGTWNLQTNLECVFSSDLTVDSVSLGILMCSTVLEAWVGNRLELDQPLSFNAPIVELIRKTVQAFVGCSSLARQTSAARHKVKT